MLSVYTAYRAVRCARSPWHVLYPRIVEHQRFVFSQNASSRSEAQSEVFVCSAE